MEFNIIKFTFLLITFISTTIKSYAVDLNFNNGSENQYKEASQLSGANEFIQGKTRGLWPRKRDGKAYNVGKNEVETRENNDFIIIETNNIPDHQYHTNNPNCANPQNFKFLIPKSPQSLEKPQKVTKRMQLIGVAVNGVVIAGPYDSENKIAPYNRKVDQCGAHADPAGMYHYHFSPLCLSNNRALNPMKQIGWAFDGHKIFGLADREKHFPIIDSETNGHEHDGMFHYHATVDFPFFVGAFKGKPEASNFNQKKMRGSSCPKGLEVHKRNSVQKKGKRPNFQKAERVLGISVREIKKALGPPPGNYKRAAKMLGINVKKLRKALSR